MDNVGTTAPAGRNGSAGHSATPAPNRRQAHEPEQPQAPVQVRIDDRATTGERAAPGNAASPGHSLRLARLAQRLTLAQVAAATRIRTAYLEAIEDDDYGLLPSSPHARAFVQSYARYLATQQSTRDPRSRSHTEQASLDPDALVALYERRRRPRAPHRVVRAGRRSPRLSWLRLAGIGAALGLGTLIVLLLINPSWLQRGPSLAILPGVGSGATPTTIGSSAAAAGPGIVVRAEATEGVWIRVTIDGQLAQEGLLAVGERTLWSGQQSIHIRSGNARALSVSVNGQDLGPLGTQDEVIERTFLAAAQD